MVNIELACYSLMWTVLYLFYYLCCLALLITTGHVLSSFLFMITSNYVIIEVTYINSFKYLSNFLVMSEKKKSMYSASVHVKDFRIQQSILSGWKRGFVISFMIGTFVITLYPILVDPLLHEDKYSKLWNIKLRVRVIWVLKKFFVTCVLLYTLFDSTHYCS